MVRSLPFSWSPRTRDPEHPLLGQVIVTDCAIADYGACSVPVSIHGAIPCSRSGHAAPTSAHDSRNGIVASLGNGGSWELRPARKGGSFGIGAISASCAFFT